jgi:phosphopantetheinyl transferase
MLLKVYCQNIENSGDYGKPGDLVVYHGLGDSFTNKLPLFYDYLSDYERSKADRFKHECDYSSYVSMHALLRIELSKLLKTKARSIKIGVTEYGKPFIPDIDLPFSLSSSRNLFAFVVGRKNQFLGIDIEQIKPEIDFINISRNYFSVEEQQLVLSFNNIADQKRTFFEIWTRKEALLKAIGVGINTELTKIPVLLGGNILNMAGVQISNHVFKIATAMKKEALISIASSVDFFPEFKNLSYILF